MSDAKNDVEPFVIDNKSLYLGIEDDGHSIDSYSYLSLRQLRFEGLGDEKQHFLLFFDQGIVEVKGSNLIDLYHKVGKHEVSLLRRGISKDPNHPSVSSVRFIEPEKVIKQK